MLLHDFKGKVCLGACYLSYCFKKILVMRLPVEACTSKNVKGYL